MNKSWERVTKKLTLTFTLVLSILLFFYSLVGVLQAVSMSAGPNYSKDQLTSNLEIWGAVSLVSLGIAIYIGLRMSSKSR